MKNLVEIAHQILIKYWDKGLEPPERIAVLVEYHRMGYAEGEVEDILKGFILESIEDDLK